MRRPLAIRTAPPTNVIGVPVLSPRTVLLDATLVKTPRTDPDKVPGYGAHPIGFTEEEPVRAPRTVNIYIVGDVTALLHDPEHFVDAGTSFVQQSGLEFCDDGRM